MTLRDRLHRLTGGESAYPLLILFGLNAVDELDRTAFGVLLPEIRTAFGLDLKKTLGLVGLVSVAALVLQVPVAQLADRTRRVPLAIGGAVMWALFSGMTALPAGLVMLAVARSGSAVGKAVVDPTHNSLLADYYPVQARAGVYGFHRAANALGAFVGPLAAGLIAYEFGWRWPFAVFMIPTLVLCVLALRMREPVRGRWERQAAGGADVETVEEPAASFAESWRTVQKVPSLRRLWWALPFLATSLIGFVAMAAVMYDREFHLNERSRGIAAAIAEPFAVVGIVIGTRIVTRRFAMDMRGLMRFLQRIALGTSVLFVAFALAPNAVVAVAVNAGIAAALAILGPGITVALSLAIPARARATGFSVGALWVIPGLLVLPLVGWIGDQWSIRWGMLVMVPLYIIGALVLGSVQYTINGDIAQVWQSSVTRAEMLEARRHGIAPMLVARGIDAGYGGRPVLSDCHIAVAEGEIVALLGTNGAGKSTLLKVLSGIVEADRGAVVLDGRDITHAPPEEIAALGIVQVPGGQAVFGGLTVDENLDLAAWNHRRDDGSARRDALALFPVLVDRLHDKAGDLSGGQQQMLALAMALIAKPKVLLIDELSLGLAPAVVGQLLPVVQRIAAQGTAVVLVEQSVNIALSIATRAYFMERGRVQFEGPAADLLERPDLLRSVFLAGAAGTPAERTIGVPAGEPGELPALEVRDLTRSFGGVRAVRGASFVVGRREVVGIIGPNGAGKTTMFDIVSGFTAATGTVLLDGVDISELRPAQRARRGLGRSFQDAKLFPDLTVRETLAIATERFARGGVVGAALRLPWHFDAEKLTTARVDELVELLSLGDFQHKALRELSTGTRRVVDLACEVAHRPTIILLDEPSSGIAQREVEALAPVLLRLRDEMGASLLVIEHDIPLISSISDRLVALEQGAVIATGPPAEVLADPVVVDSFLGGSDVAVARSTIHQGGQHATSNQ